MSIFKLLWDVFTTLIGIIFIILLIVMWLGFLGVIPQGQISEEEHFGEINDYFP